MAPAERYARMSLPQALAGLGFLPPIQTARPLTRPRGPLPQVMWDAVALDAEKGDNNDEVVTLQEVTESTATQ